MLTAVSLVLVVTLATSLDSQNTQNTTTRQTDKETTRASLREGQVKSVRLSSLPDTQGVTVIKDSYPTSQASVEFGTGYNTLTLSRTYTSPVSLKTSLRARAGFIECVYKIKLCKNREEFHASFSGGISASASYMGVEGSASVHFLTDTSITSLDTVLVATVDAITDTQTATNPRLKETPLELLQEGRYKRFVETYGTHYLRKVTLGGQLTLLLKFSSLSLRDKWALDAALALSTGRFSSQAEFSSNMEHIRGSSSLEVSVYASGSTAAPPKPNIPACIQYTIDYAESVLLYPTVREVEYAALWTVPGVPTRALKEYLFPLQAETDTLVGISVELHSVHDDVVDMLALKDSDLSFIRPAAWTHITSIQEEVDELRRTLQTKYMTSYVTQYTRLIEEFSGQAEILSNNLEKVLEKERQLGEVTLKSAGTGGYISTHIGSYPRLDIRSPVPLTLEDTDTGDQDITTGVGHYIYVRAAQAPHNALCMRPHNWYVSWANPGLPLAAQMTLDMCQWRVAHTSDVRRRVLEYGDRIILYNRHWQGFVIGVSEDHKWLKCVTDTTANDKAHQWVVERGE